MGVGDERMLEMTPYVADGLVIYTDEKGLT